MRTYPVRDLIHMTEDEIWQLNTLQGEPLEIVFDDETLHTRPQPTIFSWYIWQLFRDYDKAPVLLRHHTHTTRISANTHLKYFSLATETIFEAYNKQVDLDHVSKRIYELTNAMYNAFVQRLEDEVTSIDILDFLEVTDHPKVRQSTDKLSHNAREIDGIYEEVRQILKDPNELIGNAIAEAVKSGLVKDNQVMQCVVARGSMSDIDSNIFPQPILDNYTSGITTLHDSMVESRSAAKSQINTTGPVRDAEYFNRLEQLITSFVIGVETVDGQERIDCGSQNYREYFLTAQDFQMWLGKYYWDDASQSLKVLKKTDRHLTDTLVKFRSVFDCKVTSRQHFCRTCYGDLYFNIPHGANLGHTAATTTCKDVSQIIISTKHYDASAVGELMQYGDYELKYVQLGTDPNHILLNPRLGQYDDVRMTISSEEATRLSEIMTGEIASMSIRRISSISEVRIDYTSRTGEEIAFIPVSMGTQHSSMSHSLLTYLKTHRWELDERGNYQIDLSEWDYKDVAFVMPMKQMSMMDFFLTVEYVLKSKRTQAAAKRTIIPGIKHLKNIKEPWEGLLYLHDIVRQKFQINIVHLELMVQALRVMHLRERDYRLPTGSEYGQIGDFVEVINNRSLGAKLAYERIMDLFDQPVIDIIEDRHPHPMDYMLMGERLE